MPLMSDIRSSRPPARTLYGRLIAYVRPHLRLFIAALTGTLVMGASEPLLAYMLKPLLDGSFVDKNPVFITWMPLALAGLFVVRGAADFVSNVGMNAVAHRVVADLRQALFDRLLVLPARAFDEQSGGAMLSRLTYDTQQVMSASTQALVTLVRDTVAVSGLLAYMFWVDWQLSLAALIIAPAIAITVRVISRRLRRTSRTVQQQMGELTHVIDEAIQGHKEIRIFAGQGYERDRFARINQRVRRFQVKLVAAGEGSTHVVQFFTVCALATVIYLASLRAAGDQLTVGEFVSLFGAMALMLTPIKRLTKLNEQIQRGLAAAESIFNALDQPAEQDSGQGELVRAQGSVRFDGVRFRYRDSAEEALRDIDLDIAPGETVALVGASGSGKTTLMALLPRLYEPTDGRILIDGIPATDLSLRSLRHNIAYVGQQVVLFNDTVRANIAYGRPEANDEMVKQAARDANAWEFIEALPEGLDTPVGENGSRLSGGQRQRVAIARALLKNAPILILDEATSALDTRSERLVQEALDRLRRGRTAFIIAHRLSTVENADRIVVLDRGRIVEQGRHTQLLNAGGPYASLHRVHDAEAGDRS